MLKIETGRATFKARYATASSDGDRLAIMLETDRPISEVAAAFEDTTSLRGVEENNPKIVHMYEGYTELDSVTRIKETGTLRVMMSVPEEA